MRPLATYDTTVFVNFKPISRPIQSSYGQAANRLFDVTIDCIVAGGGEEECWWTFLGGRGGGGVGGPFGIVLNCLWVVLEVFFRGSFFFFWCFGCFFVHKKPPNPPNLLIPPNPPNPLKPSPPKGTQRLTCGG